MPKFQREEEMIIPLLVGALHLWSSAPNQAWIPNLMTPQCLC